MGTAKSFNQCRRRHPREDVTLAGSAMSVTRSRSVMISDISALGARIGGRDLPKPGDDILVVVGSQERMGTVKWSGLENCGIALDQPLGHSNIAQMKREAHWASVTGWGR